MDLTPRTINSFLCWEKKMIIFPFTFVFCYNILQEQCYTSCQEVWFTINNIIHSLVANPSISDVIIFLTFFFYLCKSPKKPLLVWKANTILFCNKTKLLSRYSKQNLSKKSEIYWNVRVSLCCCFQVSKERAAKFITLE